WGRPDDREGKASAAESAGGRHTTDRLRYIALLLAKPVLCSIDCLLVSSGLGLLRLHRIGPVVIDLLRGDRLPPFMVTRRARRIGPIIVGRSRSDKAEKNCEGEEIAHDCVPCCCRFSPHNTVLNASLPM